MDIDPATCESFIDDDHKLCPRCSTGGKVCCEIIWVTCEQCDGDGIHGHDCGEDCCCCLYPEENMPCDICLGEGGWWACMGGCDENGKHAAQGNTGEAT